MPDVLSASQLADERAKHRAEVAALIRALEQAENDLRGEAFFLYVNEKNVDSGRFMVELADRLRDARQTPVRETDPYKAQRDAWAARYTDLAAAVLEGAYLNYDVKEDSGGSSFLCTCEHDGDGWPHEEWCGKVLLSTLDYSAEGSSHRPRSVSVHPAASSTRETAQTKGEQSA